jgi:hypothetical protein
VAAGDRAGGRQAACPIAVPGAFTLQVSPFLLRAIRTVIRVDSDPVRQALFTNLRQSRLTIRAIYGLHELFGRSSAAAMLTAGYGTAAWLMIAPPAKRRARVLMVARHANARREVGRVAAWVGKDECCLIESRLKASPRLFVRMVTSLLASPAGFIKAFRIVRSVDRRHGFLIACRVAGALAWYARSKAILQREEPESVVVSSDSNPEEAGFTAAARSFGLPTVFISHAYPTPLSPQLDFSLSILEGEAEVRARERKGPIKGRVVLAGVEGESAPFDVRRFDRPAPVIGIFTPKAISWSTLREVISDCRQHYHALRILIRWHPSMLETPRLAHEIPDLTGVIETPTTSSLVEIAQQCDWVVADENSAVHLPVLKLGIPTIAVRHLGVYPESRSDLYGFAHDRVIFPPVSSIRDVEREAFVHFFSEDWAERFEHYDASYLRSQVVIANEVRRAVWDLSRNSAEGVTCA